MQKIKVINLSKSNIKPSAAMPSKALTIINHTKHSFAGTVTVTVLPLPLANIIIPSNPCSNGNVQTYSIAQQTDVSYTWTSSINPTPISGTSATYAWGSGSGAVTLTATNTDTHCANTSTIQEIGRAHV